MLFLFLSVRLFLLPTSSSYRIVYMFCTHECSLAHTCTPSSACLCMCVCVCVDRSFLCVCVCGLENCVSGNIACALVHKILFFFHFHLTNVISVSLTHSSSLVYHRLPTHRLFFFPPPLIQLLLSREFCFPPCALSKTRHPLLLSSTRAQHRGESGSNVGASSHSMVTQRLEAVRQSGFA